ncbi:MAG: hypothetical protein K2O45_14710, partial [Oscillospiraceae bacterium]|nr:hypothetical protein [Oscillospiraceae bacterium]
VYGKSNGDGDWDRGYSGTYDIYSQVPGGEKTKLLSDVSDVLDISVDGGKVSLVYLTTEMEEHTLYDFVSDSLASSDAGQREPSYDDYQTTNAWGWWTTDWEAYNAAYEVWSAVESRNYLRQSLKDTPYTVTTYTLNRYENGEKSTLAAELAFYPTFSAGAGVYLYARSEQEISAVCDVQDLAYSSDIYGMMDAAERSWYQNVGGEESPFDLDEDSSLDDLYVLNGNEAVLVVYEDGEALLQTYSVDKKGLTFVSTITDDDFSFPVMGRSGGKDALYYFTDMDKDRSTGELICYANGKETSVAKDADRVVLLDDGTVFKLEDISYNDRRSQTEGSLYVVKNGKSERIADDVFVWRTAYLSGSQVAYISDGDLFVWNGKDSEKLASDVTNFWSSSQAGYQSFSCN